MARATQRQLAQALIDDHGQLYSDQLGIALDKGTPSPLFRWLCASILFSARISQNIALAAAKALADQGWTTAPKLAAATWSQRTKTLNRSGYARYDERTSTMLGESAELLIERYGGDLRKLRQEADRDSRRERSLLKEFKGLGDVGVDIFFREAQIPWQELFPFADRRALAAAQKLGLGGDARSLARLTSQEQLPRLVAALVRVDLQKVHDEVREKAGSG